MSSLCTPNDWVGAKNQTSDERLNPSLREIQPHSDLRATDAERLTGFGTRKIVDNEMLI